MGASRLTQFIFIYLVPYINIEIIEAQLTFRHALFSMTDRMAKQPLMHNQHFGPCG